MWRDPGRQGLPASADAQGGEDAGPLAGVSRKGDLDGSVRLSLRVVLHYVAFHHVDDVLGDVGGQVRNPLQVA